MGFSRGNNKGRKLNPDQVGSIRRRYEEGWTQGELARAEQVSVGQIGRIVRGESWQAGQIRAVEAREEVQPLRTEGLMERLARIQAEGEVERGEKTRSSAPPPSLLDGGDAPDETEGAGLQHLVTVKPDAEA